MRPRAMAEFERLWARKEREYRRVGFSERVIRGGKQRAIGWLEGLTGIWNEHRRPKLAEEYQLANVPHAIEHSKEWMIEITEAFAPPDVVARLKKRLKEVV